MSTKSTDGNAKKDTNGKTLLRTFDQGNGVQNVQTKKRGSHEARKRVSLPQKQAIILNPNKKKIIIDLPF